MQGGRPGQGTTTKQLCLTKWKLLCLQQYTSTKAKDLPSEPSDLTYRYGKANIIQLKRQRIPRTNVFKARVRCRLATVWWYV